jgi:hypothetical protein
VTLPKRLSGARGKEAQQEVKFRIPRMKHGVIRNQPEGQKYTDQWNRLESP